MRVPNQPINGVRNAPDATQQRDLSALTIAVRAETVDEASRTVQTIAATERVVQVFDFRRMEVIDEVLVVKGMQPAGRVPMLANHFRHDLDAVHGGASNFTPRGEEVLATLTFDDDERSERAWKKVKRGFITDVSVGYRVDEYDEIQCGESKKIFGKTYTANGRVLRVATKWTIREVSLVPVGADPAAKIRNDQGDSPPNQPERTSPVNKKLRAYLQSIGLRSDASAQDAQAFLTSLQGEQARHAAAVQADPDAYEDDGITKRSDAGQQGGSGTQQPPAGQPPSDGQRSAPPAEPASAGGSPTPTQSNTPSNDTDPNAIAQRAANLERERIAGIRALATDQTPEALITRAINEVWTADQAATAILQHERSLQAGDGGAQPNAPAMHTNSLQGNDMVRALGAGLCLRGGLDFQRLPVAIRSDGDDRTRAQERLADQGERYSDMSLVDYCRHALQAENRPIPHRREDMIRAAVSTSTLGQIFTDSVNAHMTLGFETAADTSRLWTEEGDVADFKTNTDITLGKTSGMTKLARGGTANHAQIDDEAETYKVARYAEQFAADEQDIIDDMMNVLTELPREMAEEAAQLRPDLVYSILLANPTMGDGTALFHSGHGNTDTDVLGPDGLKALITAMAKQTRGNRQLNLHGKHLILPHDLRFTARQLVESQEIREAAAANGTKNVLADEGLKVVPENRLGVAGVTDPSTGTAYTGTATNWFLAAPRRTIKVVYRAGTNRTPQVRRFVLDRGQWGIGWDINLDIGAFARDFRGLQKSTGGG